MGKCLYEIKECEYKSDGMCSYRCSYEEKENANFGYPLLADGCVTMDKRRYLSMIADIQDSWRNGSKGEMIGMEWMARQIYNKFIVTEKKATVS
jgi:hypothetical protein